MHPTKDRRSKAFKHTLINLEFKRMRQEENPVMQRQIHVPPEDENCHAHALQMPIENGHETAS
jgi:hypothetical protein